MPELPEVQAHAERLTAEFGGRTLQRFTALSFTALKTFDPPPESAVGESLARVGRRGKQLLVEFESRQHLFVADAAPRIRVFPIHEGTDGELAITDDTRRDALCDRGHLAADHQHAIVVAGHVRLNNHVSPATLAKCHVEAPAYVVFAAQVKRHSAAVVSVEWLDHDRKTDLVRRSHGVICRAHYL